MTVGVVVLVISLIIGCEWIMVEWCLGDIWIMLVLGFKCVWGRKHTTIPLLPISLTNHNSLILHSKTHSLPHSQYPPSPCPLPSCIITYCSIYSLSTRTQSLQSPSSIQKVGDTSFVSQISLRCGRGGGSGGGWWLGWWKFWIYTVIPLSLNNYLRISPG